MNNKKLVLSAAIAGLAGFALSGTPALADHHEKGGKVACYGSNACKGKSACKTAHNECKGHNKCKGHGKEMMSEKDCKAKGGKTEEAHS